MPLQQHNGLARPADYFSFRRRSSPCWHMSGLVRTDSVLAYGQRDSAYWRACIGTGQTPGRTR